MQSGKEDCDNVCSYPRKFQPPAILSKMATAMMMVCKFDCQGKHVDTFDYDHTSYLSPAPFSKFSGWCQKNPDLKLKISKDTCTCISLKH